MTGNVAYTLALQVGGPVIFLAFGLLALRVAPAPGTSPSTAAWFMAGVTFIFDGAVATAHSTCAVVAMLLGTGSRFYGVFVQLTPAANDARSLLVLGFAAGLVWVLLLGRPAPTARAVVAAACLLMLAGAAVGLVEPPFDQREGGDHLELMSLLGAATALLLFAALYRGMVRGRVDWLLWVALALYAAQEALTSNIQGVLAWAGLGGGGWKPPVRSMLWAWLVASGVMLACSLRRLAIARTGRQVPGLLERLRG